MNKEELLQDLADAKQSVVTAENELKEAEKWLVKQYRYLAEAYEAVHKYDQI